MHAFCTLMQHNDRSLVSTDFSIANLGCSGSELSLYDCHNSNCSVNNCNYCTANRGAGVICEYEPPSDTIVELVGGNNTVGNVLLDGRPIW